MLTSSSDLAASYRENVAVCRRALAHGSKTFYAASHFLPADVRGPASALYAFCRLADDAVDEGGDLAALEALHRRLDRLYAGRPAPHAADRALAHVVARQAVPRELPEALLEGFAWDLEGRRYETLDDLIAYAARVAGTVGAMMALLMNARSPDAIARATDLGVAMQLTNIARDVGEDASRGRLYLPLEWLREAGIDPDDWLARPVFDQRLARIVARLLEAADRYYAGARSGLGFLPLSCRPGIQASRIVYAEIGREVERRGYDSVSTRAVVRRRRKAWLLAVAMSSAWWPSAGGAAAPVHPACRFVVDAVVDQPPPLPEGGLAGRVAWLIDLFTRLEQRDRAARSHGGASAVPGST